MKGKLRLLLLVIDVFLVRGPAALFAADGETEPNLFVSTNSIDHDTAGSLKGLFQEAVSRELRIAGFNVIVVENSTDRSDLLKTAQLMRAYYQVENTVSVDGTRLTWEIRCYSLADDTVLAPVSRRTDVASLTDTEIRKTLDPIIRSIWEHMRAGPNGGTEADAIDATIRPKPFTIEAGLGPFVATGAVSRYFKAGIEAFVFAGYRVIDSGAANLSTGITTIVNSFHAEGSQASSDICIVSAGPELRWGFDVSPFLCIFLRLGAGASLFMMDVDKTGIKSAVIPFLSVGPGARMQTRLIPPASLS
ncbi:MAG: hypothetical protein HC888_13055 [Candidatus Competibacteraceae bacterium]|nr:hypothetical protein [Candidatus Competibacteraceae bacterium]